MKMKSTANTFADSLARQGASKETVCSYCKSVELFYSQYDEVTVDHLLAYKAYLLEHYAVNTVNARVYGLNRYLKFLEESEQPEKIACGLFSPLNINPCTPAPHVPL